MDQPGPSGICGSTEGEPMDPLTDTNRAGPSGTSGSGRGGPIRRMVTRLQTRVSRLLSGRNTPESSPPHQKPSSPVSSEQQPSSPESQSQQMTDREQQLQARREREAQRRANESAEEREQRLQVRRRRDQERRNAESDKQRTERLQADRDRNAAVRANEMQEERDARLEADRQRVAAVRASQTEEERDARLAADRQRVAIVRASDTQDEHDARLEAERQRRAAESDEQRDARLQNVRLAQDERRQNETQQQREQRLEENRQREQVRRRVRAAGTMYRAAVLGTEDAMPPTPHDLGPMTVDCQYAHCGAKHFRAERGTLTSSCCNNGKVAVHPLQLYPEQLRQLLTGGSDVSKKFRDHIRQYNSANAFASFGAKTVDIPGRGPYLFKISGEIYHRATSALVETPDPPADQPAPRYGQLFIYDPEAAVNFRVENQQNKGCEREAMLTLDQVLRAVNPYVHQYRRLNEAVREEEARMRRSGTPMRQFELRLVRHQRDDPRRYNPPPPTNKDCMIVVESGDGDVPTMDLAVHPRGKFGCTRISPYSMHTDPMVFPILFPNGEPGWFINMQNAYPVPQQTKETLTPAKFYAWRIAVRDHFNPLHHAGKLFQQYVIHAYCTIESQRLLYLSKNQEQLRVDCYRGLIDFLAEEAEERGLRPGNLMILPSSFVGGPRPDLFITFTCNPNWPEIEAQLQHGQVPNDRPDIISRVFELKRQEMMRLILKEKIFGDVLAYVFVVEFQKRGLPHMHALFWLSEEDQFHTGEQIDRVISAELPNRDTEKDLYEIVKKHLIHGPCGVLKPDNVCMDRGACTKRFPKDFQDYTDITGDGYPKYRRRNNANEDHTIGYRNLPIDNRWVVPYNPFLAKTFNAHINVEMCHTILAIKYLCKYFMKGHDRAKVALRQVGGDLVLNEIKEFVDTRCITPPEATWHLLGNPLHEQSHSIYELAVHLPDGQRIFFEEDQAEEAARRAATRDTTLTAWFKLNQEDPHARTILYQDVALHYTKVPGTSVRWKIRERGHGGTIGRIASVSPKNIELYHLRLLLLNVRGAASFEDLRTFDGELKATFREAALALGLVVDDEEWRRCMDEARLYAMPCQLRSLFAVLLINCEVINADQLWQEFRPDMTEDFRFNNRYNEREADSLALLQIQSDLQAAGTSCTEQGIPEPDPMVDHLQGLDEDPAASADRGRQMFDMLNDAQRVGAEQILEAVNTEDRTTSHCFFVDGPGGTGKTFLYDTLINILHGLGKKILAVAYTGIAAILLPGGKTCHTAFRLPLNLRSDSSCNLSSKEKEALLQTDVILWDESPMASSDMLEVVDRALRDLMHNERVPFGGKIVIMGGDFRQTLPVVQRGTRLQIVRKCIKSCPVFHHFNKIELTVNMRARPEEIEFARWVLQLGDGRLPCPINSKTPDSIVVPPQCISQDAVRDLFGEEFAPNDETVYSRVLLCPINEDVRLRNEEILHKLIGDKMTFRSIDAIGSVGGEDVDIQQQMYPTEFLNTVHLAGLPPHELNLKRGAVVMLIRNLCLAKGLCNGTRMVVMDYKSKVLQVRILSGTHRGTTHFIPRITLNTKDDVNVPFNLCRRQFPVKLANAMTINKAQGQTFEKVGVYLRTPVFTHGQLYVACSRVGSFDSLRVQVFDTDMQGKVDGVVMTENIVFREVFGDTNI